MPGAKIESLSSVFPPKGNFYQRIIDYVFRPMRRGRLTIVLPEGQSLVYGNGRDGVEATILVKHQDFFKRCVLFGDVGFGESYVAGEWETDDLTKVVEWMILNVENHPTLMDKKTKIRPVNFLRWLNNILRLFRQNTIRGSRKNIEGHYDLGNDFYQLFLDPTMTYSCAYYKDVQQTLQQAQIQKYEELCRKIRLKESDRVLEIGSGWGGFSIYAASHYGCRVSAVTISRQQYEYAQKRINDLGLSNLIDIRLKDYRHAQGKYDKIVSIEMIEAVGHKFYKAYFRECHQLLKKDGILALQMILAPDHRYESFRKNMDFIQKYIFPGSLLPSISVIQKALNETGDLGLFDYQDITPHYVRTLAQWRQNFNHQLKEIRALGFDEAFIRKWDYYWCYCEAAFKTRNISVVQTIYTRPNNRVL